MADTKTNEAKISIKVVVHKVKKRVVYAVADHTFVDILFSFMIMTLPMGTIVKILGKLDDKKFEVLGSLNNLYQSLKDFPECYFATKECKSMLLNPRSLSFDHCRYLTLKIDDTVHVRYYVCNDRMCPVFGEVLSYNMSGMGYNGFRGFGEGRCRCSELMSLEYVPRYPLLQVLQFLEMSLSTDCPFTHLAFSKIHNSIRESVGTGQCINPDEFDLVKKEVSTSSKMVLEVSLQRSTGKLLFAEAKADFVEFLFSVLSLPLGTVVGTLMNGASSVSCMNNIFKSISNMSVGGYLKSQDIKEMLLKPHIRQEYSSKLQIFTLSDNASSSIIYKPEDLLKQCGMFVVTDDLTITPSSSFSTIDILKKFKVSFPEDIERYEVSIGLKEGLSILKASLISRLTFTSSLEHQLKK